jgi:hypothetical protein
MSLHILCRLNSDAFRVSEWDLRYFVAAAEAKSLKVPENSKFRPQPNNRQRVSVLVAGSVAAQQTVRAASLKCTAVAVPQ